MHLLYHIKFNILRLGAIFLEVYLKEGCSQRIEAKLCNLPLTTTIKKLTPQLFNFKSNSNMKELLHKVAVGQLI